MVLLSLVLMPLNCYWVQQMEIVWYSAQPTTISLYFHVVFTLVVLLVGNWLLRSVIPKLGAQLRGPLGGLAGFFETVAPRMALQPGELLVLYIMLAISTSLAGHDCLEILVPIMGHATWFATPENRWQELFGRYLPPHLTVSDRKILEGFYLGNSSLYTAERLAAWAVPVAIWTGFILVALFTMLCINCIVRRQWTERERLSYPIIQLPLEIADPKLPLFRNRLLWMGFALAAAIDILNGLAYHYPSVPMLPVRVTDLRPYITERPWSGMGWMPVTFYPFAVGLGYLLPLDLLFSSWFFFWFWKAQRVITFALGWESRPDFPYVNQQSFGGYMGLAIFALWSARHHLREVGAKMLGRPSTLDDRGEPMSYRWASIGALVGMIALISFISSLGMSVPVAILFFVIYFAISFAVTRMRAELGPPAHDLHDAGPDRMMTSAWGTEALGARNLTLFSVFFWLNRAYRGHPMPHQLEGLKIGERSHLDTRGLIWAMMFAGFIGAIAGMWGMLHIGYHYGMATGNVLGPALVFGREPYNRLGSWLTSPQPANTAATAAMVIGAVFSLGLLFLRTRFLGWPFHPVGYAVSGSWSMHLLWMPLFIAWLIKLLTLHFGGLRLYRRAMPFFLGLILGEHIVGGGWSLIGVIGGFKTYVFWPYS